MVGAAVSKAREPGARMTQVLSPSAQKVQDALLARGFTYQVTESEQVTRTAAEAAEVVGCTVGQIAKSLVFRGVASGQPILVIASGANRVNEAQIGQHVGEPIGKATCPICARADRLCDWRYSITGAPAALDDLCRPGPATVS